MPILSQLLVQHMQKRSLQREFGCGLHEILRAKSGHIYGILNGIDIDWRHTSRIPAVKFPYGPKEKRVGEKNTIL